MLILLIYFLSQLHQPEKVSGCIVEQETDERGLISVVIEERDGRQWAYDYLTPDEFYRVVKELSE